MQSTFQTIILNQSNNVTPPSTTLGYANKLRVNFGMPMTLVGKEIALYNLFAYYSWFNVTAADGNNVLQLVCTITDNTGNVESTFAANVVLPDGNYPLSEINQRLKEAQFVNKMGPQDSVKKAKLQSFSAPLQIVVDAVRYCVRIVSTPRNDGFNRTYHVQLVIPNTPYVAGNTGTEDARSMSQIFGFPPGIYPASINMVDQGEVMGVRGTPGAIVLGIPGPFPPDLTSTNQVNVTCNMVNNSMVSANQSSTICSFSPTTSFGSQIVVTPQQLVWFPIIDGQYSYLEITLLDDNFMPLKIRDPVVSCTVLIRSKQQQL